MELNSKKLERTSRIIYYSISTILSLFLILLSNKIIADLDTATVIPEIENFENKVVMNDLNKKIDTLNIEVDNLTTKKETIEKTIATAKENYTNEKQSFDNWVQTRKTLGSPDKDQEVIERAKKLDEFYKIEQDWRSQLNLRQVEIDQRVKNQLEIQKLIAKEQKAAETKYYVAFKY
jgi:outer membrane murein-binding lipoprotein Lpp